MKNGRGVFLLAIPLVSLLSCSFNYTDDSGKDGPMPEIVLINATANRYKDANLSVTFKAATLEIYDGDAVWAGKGVSFLQYPDGGSGESEVASAPEAEGMSGLLLIDNKEEIYSLGDTVAFTYLPENMRIEASDLRWERKTHRLSSPLDAEVLIQKGDGTSLRGNGFFADTLSWKYELHDSVNGELSSDAAPESAPLVETPQ